MSQSDPQPKPNGEARTDVTETLDAMRALSTATHTPISVIRGWDEMDDQMPQRLRLDIVHLMEIAEQATGLSSLLCDVAFNGNASIGMDRLRTVRKRIYGTFGAPGAWGYDTPIGAALCRLYSVRILPPSADVEGD